MTDVRIGRLELRGRLPGDDAAARARAEQIVVRACDELLEQAFERAGVREDGELCIRALDVAAQLPWGRGDVAMATAWSVQVADAARAAVEAGGSGVVRYDSVAQALCDVLNGAAQGDFGRAWAWSQLGLWPGGGDVRGVVAALTARPELCAAALHETAARDRLAPLLRALPGEAWTRIARAALVAVGLSPALADVAPTHGTLAKDEGSLARERASHHAAPDAASPATADKTDDEAAQVALRARARAVATASPLGRAARRAAAFGLSPAARRALAVLALADADPAALRGARAQQLVSALDDELRARSGGAGPQARRHDDASARASDRKASGARVAAEARDDERGVSVRDDATQADARTGSAARDVAERAARRRDAAEQRARNDAREGGAPADGERSAAAPDGRADDVKAERSARAHTPDDARDEDAPFDFADADAGGDSEPPIARQRGHTRFGGLLFLLHVVDALGLPGEWSEAGPLAARPLRVALHGLALALLRDAGHDNVASDDPAVLAFAGLRPLDPSPSRTTNGATEPQRTQSHETEESGASALRREADAPEALTHEEQAAIDAGAARVAAALTERLYPAVPPLPRHGGEGWPRRQQAGDFALPSSRWPLAARASQRDQPGWGEGEGDSPTSATPQPSPDPSAAGAGEGSAAVALAGAVTPEESLGDLRGVRSSAARLAQLVARRAEIVADPGWIELRLALDEIDTRVRRAGLDLDPGYVPWLGVVVKFRYV